MRRTILTLAAAFAALALSAAAQAQTPLQTADTAKCKVFVDAKGVTLHAFDRDTTGKSACNGPCAANWPPLRPPDNGSVRGSSAR